MPRLATLGGLALVGEDGPLVGPAARGRNLALLAILARADEAGVAREKLAAMLWPESDEARARHSLGQALYTLRRALGADTLIAGGTSIALNRRAIECDVVAFTDALDADDQRRAVDAYAGPFLDGFHLSGAAEFERWTDSERALLHGRYAAALEALAVQAADRGDETMAVDCWRRLAAAEPLSSRVALGLMRALDRAGDRAGAVQAALVHQALVREELDSPPDPSILDLAAVLKRDPRPGVSARQGETDLPPAHPVTGSVGEGTASAFPSRPVDAPRRVMSAGREASSHARRWLALGTAIIAVAAMLVVVASRRAAARAASVAAERTRVTVEPLENDTGDPTWDMAGRMAAHYLTDGLTRTGLVQVVEAGVGGAPDAVVSGRIHATADSVVYMVRLVRPADGTVQRTITVSMARAANPAAALEPLRQRTLGAIGTLYDPRVASWSDATLRPPTFDAFREFAAGIELISFPRDPAGAAARFESAAELDPQFALPRLWLAWTLTMDYQFARADSVARSLEPVRNAMSPLERAWHDRITAAIAGDNEMSFQAARRMAAIAHRPGWVIALASSALDTNRPRTAVAALLEAGMDSLGIETAFPWFTLTAAYHSLQDYEAELSATEEAIDAIGLAWGFLGPGVPGMAALGRIKELEQRIRELQHVELEGGMPAGPIALATAVAELRAHGFASEAASLFEELDAGPAGPGADPTDAAALAARVRALYELGRWDEAARMHEVAPRTPQSDVAWTGMRGLLAARREDPETARRIADHLETNDDPFLFGEDTFLRARMEAVLGNHDRAITLIRQAFAEGLYGNGWYALHVLRDFDALRNLAAFRELVEPRR